MRTLDSRQRNRKKTVIWFLGRVLRIPSTDTDPNENVLQWTGVDRELLKTTNDDDDGGGGDVDDESDRFNRMQQFGANLIRFHV